MIETNRDDRDHAAIAQWFDTWSGYIAAADFVSARALFERDVVGFGTWMDVVEGIEKLEALQWRSIWPVIADFHFLTESLQVRVSPDRCLAVAVIVWSSTGFHQDGTSYPRPGRASVAFRRDHAGAAWKGIHTHLSLNRGVPQKSYRRRSAQG